MKSVEEYIAAHIDSESDLLKKIDRDTHARLLYSNMNSGHIQGRFLAMITKMLGANRVLEIGAFAGYSALCMAEGLAEGGELHTIEVNDELEDTLLANFNASEHGSKIHLHIGDAGEIIPSFADGSFDLAFLDADKSQYAKHYQQIFPKIRNGGVIVVDNTLWYGKVLDEAKQNDVATRAVQEFNKMIAEDNRVDKVILPLRDGLTLIRKK